jgi:integrase
LFRNHVDLERRLLLLPDSKTGRKTINLNRPALSILQTHLPRGPFVIPGDDPERPRSDLKKPWAAVCRHAGLIGLRIHDLRRTFASIGAGASLGLPIVGKLLGHSQPQTAARYAHLDVDPYARKSYCAKSKGVSSTKRRSSDFDAASGKQKLAIGTLPISRRRRNGQIRAGIV